MLRRRNHMHAAAQLRGSAHYPHIRGIVEFTQMERGVMVRINIHGLPSADERCGGNFFGFHIHEGGSCSGNSNDPFANAGGHYNPQNCPHPHHAGDLPPLLGNDGHAYMTVLTNRFTLEEIIGRTVIVHSMPDDFTSQPSGNSGEKMACGQISLVNHIPAPFEN